MLTELQILAKLEIKVTKSGRHTASPIMFNVTNTPGFVALSEKEKQKSLLDSLINIISVYPSDTEEDSVTSDLYGGFTADFNYQPLRRIVKGPD
jgi:hypothetical protein